MLLSPNTEPVCTQVVQFPPCDTPPPTNILCQWAASLYVCLCPACALLWPCLWPASDFRASGQAYLGQVTGRIPALTVRTYAHLTFAGMQQTERTEAKASRSESGLIPLTSGIYSHPALLCTHTPTYTHLHTQSNSGRMTMVTTCTHV